ncbi:hypothetical protein CNECB9_4820057 [Cupriavidus necator]|uniref:Uncharacterized protein n=1 Tax=Cupriavidus necator TaxID=106590 RepID=A0A1K0JH94_CUPNE|nr:hypothetical protein CNECB9_4820057 [Cupriavidus necator]
MFRRSPISDGQPTLVCLCSAAAYVRWCALIPFRPGNTDHFIPSPLSMRTGAAESTAIKSVRTYLSFLQHRQCEAAIFARNFTNEPSVFVQQFSGA